MSQRPVDLSPRLPRAEGSRALTPIISRSVDAGYQQNVLM